MRTKSSPRPKRSSGLSLSATTTTTAGSTGSCSSTPARRRRPRAAADRLPNGVRPPTAAESRFEPRTAPRVVMSARIAPSKFVGEATRRHGNRAAPAAARGAARHRRRRAAARRVRRRARRARAARASIAPCSSTVRTPRRPRGSPEFDVALVLGEHQGCPNACLEALAAGVPVVANDSGGHAGTDRSGADGLARAGHRSGHDRRGAARGARRIRPRRGGGRRPGGGMSRGGSRWRGWRASYLRLFAALREEGAR